MFEREQEKTTKERGQCSLWLNTKSYWLSVKERIAEEKINQKFSERQMAGHMFKKRVSFYTPLSIKEKLGMQLVLINNYVVNTKFNMPCLSLPQSLYLSLSSRHIS